METNEKSVISKIFSFFRKLFGKEEDHAHPKKLPVKLLFGFDQVPAIPFDLEELIETLVLLSQRAKATEQAKNGLTNVYEIKGHKANSYSYLFGQTGTQPDEEARKKLLDSLRNLGPLGIFKHKLTEKHLTDSEFGSVSQNSDDLTLLSLDHPDQYAMSWTNYFDLHDEYKEEYLAAYSKTLTDREAANKAFFPMLAENGLAINLRITEKIGKEKALGLKADLGSDWTDEMQHLADKDLLYAIDFRDTFNDFGPEMLHNSTHFTPSTLMLLRQDATTKDLTPFAIQVSGQNGTGKQFYHADKTKDGAWLYAMQAVKVSTTVYGIWLGHVYHWHIVTAAMQMCMLNNFDNDHPIYKLLAPHSEYLIAFDDALLLLWKNTAPPTSIASSKLFLQLCNNFATGRNFFDDDPKHSLANLGITFEDFTVNEHWDKYPIIKQQLQIWDATERYVKVFVEQSYKTNDDVKNDTQLQAWIKDSASPDEGNIKGLPTMDTKAALKQVLTSYLYRITMHGCSRMNKAANPALTFVGNFPPTLHKSDIPGPNANISTEELLEYMPLTGTIGRMMTFFFTFIFSAPYKPFIPIGGMDVNLPFGNSLSDPRNEAAVRFREDIAEFIQQFDTDSPIVHQWPASVET